MGKTTDENYRKLRFAESYDNAELSNMLSNEFTTELAILIEKKGIKVNEIVENSSLSKSYINKLRRPSEKMVRPTRNAIIDIALAVNATLEETNRLLKFARYQELYTRDKAESIIIWGLLHNLCGSEIREMLYDKGFKEMFKEREVTTKRN